MSTVLNPGNDAFMSEIDVSDNNIYVDKTDFLAETNSLLNKKFRFICFTRPRRFGKTITAKMLSAYYSKGCDSKKLFDNLKISKLPSYLEHLNKYNVIYIDMNDIKANFDSFEKTDNIHDIIDYLSITIMQELKGNATYSKIIESNKLISSKSLLKAFSEINQKINDKFIFIMDEWDLVYRDYKEDLKLQTKFLEFLRGLFKTTSGQSCFSLVYLTGILPIKKNNSESALNNFKEYNMLRPTPYERFFGFTEDEVEKLAHKYNMNFDDFRYWYDGYNLNGISILNPNSVANAIADNCIQSYWTNTAAIDSVKELIEMNFAGLKDEILDMITNNREIEFNCGTFQNDMVSINNKGDVYSLLVCLGYLACRTSSFADDVKMAYIPNKEIRLELQTLVTNEDWYLQMEVVKRSQELYKATCNLDSDKVAKIIDEIHTSPYISTNSYNNEVSLSYCITSGYSFATMSKYEITREMPTGKGFADIVYEPFIDKNLPVLIIELKYGTSAKDALCQIKKREYYKKYSKYKNILLVGINYDKQTKRHECMIEDLYLKQKVVRLQR